MASRSGVAGLKCLQWLFRGLQLACAVVILGIYSYFLATMLAHHLTTPTSVKAVEGISAAATLYALAGVLLVWCCAGHAATSFVAVLLDLALTAAYIYTAVANRAGASSCSGSSGVGSPYGTGSASATPSSSSSSSGGSAIVRLPTYGVACRMETACLAAACAAAISLPLSVLLEFGMNRGRRRASRPLRDADGRYAGPKYYEGTPAQRRDAPPAGGGLLGALRGRRRRGEGSTGRAPADPDLLPAHQQPADFTTRREPVAQQWGEVRSLHDSDILEFNDGQARWWRQQEEEEEGPPVTFTATTAPRPAAGEYAEGDVHVEGAEYNLYREDSRGNDLSETGRRKKQRESRAARIERLEAAYN